MQIWMESTEWDERCVSKAREMILKYFKNENKQSIYKYNATLPSPNRWQLQQVVLDYGLNSWLQVAYFDSSQQIHSYLPYELSYA